MTSTTSSTAPLAQHGQPSHQPIHLHRSYHPPTIPYTPLHPTPIHTSRQLQLHHTQTRNRTERQLHAVHADTRNTGELQQETTTPTTRQGHLRTTAQIRTIELPNRRTKSKEDGLVHHETERLRNNRRESARASITRPPPTTRTHQPGRLRRTETQKTHRLHRPTNTTRNRILDGSRDYAGPRRLETRHDHKYESTPDSDQDPTNYPATHHSDPYSHPEYYHDTQTK